MFVIQRPPEFQLPSEKGDWRKSLYSIQITSVTQLVIKTRKSNGDDERGNFIAWSLTVLIENVMSINLEEFVAI